jgi:hypothetical protein
MPPGTWHQPPRFAEDDMPDSMSLDVSVHIMGSSLVAVVHLELICGQGPNEPKLVCQGIARPSGKDRREAKEQ